MYGPPPDPRQLTLLYTLGDDGWRYAICLIICLTLSLSLIHISEPTRPY